MKSLNLFEFYGLQVNRDFSKKYYFSFSERGGVERIPSLPITEFIINQKCC